VVLLFSCLVVRPLFGAARETAPLAPHTHRVDAAARGQLIAASGTAGRAEVIRFGSGLPAALLATAPEQDVRVAGWPVAPGERADVVLTRHEVYAPDAKVYAVHDGRTTEVPRSRLAFLWGEAEGDADTRVFVAVDPDTGRLDGSALSSRASYELHPLDTAKLGVALPGISQYLLAPPEVFLEQAGEKPEWTCGNAEGMGFLLNQQEAGRRSTGIGSAITSLHSAVVAFDTDNELLFNKFSDNSVTATNFIASLVAQMNVIYNRDLLIQLLQGTTFLRVGDSRDGDHFNDDPWTQPSSGGAASFNQLQEVTNYWSTTYSSINRAFVAMLSGKGSSNGASGIAWVPGGALCSQSASVSFSQIFLSGTTPSFGDVLVVGHEIGHNFGTRHTHCYTPPADTCYNAESGCYSGATSCPAASTINGVTNVRGTLMSYCHLLGGCSSSLVFHPATVALLQPMIQSAAGTCIPSAFAVNGISPNNGPTSGGTAVTITGNLFQSGATVTIGGSPATSVVFVNATTLTAVTPAHAAGKAGVVVTNPDTTATGPANVFYYAPPAAASDFYTVTPCRILDTRNPAGPLGGPALGPTVQRTFTAAGTCGIPAGAVAIAANVTTVNPTASGNLAAFPGNAFAMGTSISSMAAGHTRSDNAILELATDGTGTFGIVNSSPSTIDVVVDVVGYFL
jgi:hypothetical protein